MSDNLEQFGLLIYIQFKAPLESNWRVYPFSHVLHVLISVYVLQFDAIAFKH